MGVDSKGLAFQKGVVQARSVCSCRSIEHKAQFSWLVQVENSEVRKVPRTIGFGVCFLGIQFLGVTLLNVPVDFFTMLLCELWICIHLPFQLHQSPEGGGPVVRQCSVVLTPKQPCFSPILADFLSRFSLQSCTSDLVILGFDKPRLCSEVFRSKALLNHLMKVGVSFFERQECEIVRTIVVQCVVTMECPPQLGLACDRHIPSTFTDRSCHDQVAVVLANEYRRLGIKKHRHIDLS